MATLPTKTPSNKATQTNGMTNAPTVTVTAKIKEDQREEQFQQ